MISDSSLRLAERIVRELILFRVPAALNLPSDKPIEIEKVSVSVRIVGALAETSVTLVFFNPNNRRLECELSYPLPPDATLQGYALDVNGRMVDGVPVPKQKARVVFEKEVRKQVDPGLVEWSGGNRFKTRIYPLLPYGRRTITLRYTSLVQVSEAGGSFRLPVDLDAVKQFSLRMETLSSEQPRVQASGLGALSFAPWKSAFVLEQEWENLTLHEDLVVDLPEGMATMPSVEKQGEDYVLARLLTPPAVPRLTLPTPDVVEIVWDASGSMEAVNKKPVFECLCRYFAARHGASSARSTFLRPLLWMAPGASGAPARPCKVRLIVVRNRVEPVRELLVKDGDATELIDELGSLDYDGATTDFSAVLAAEAPLRFLLTDGNVNFCLADAAPVRAGGCTCAFIASSHTDRNVLRQWGVLPIDLLRQTPEQALDSLPSCHLDAIRLNGKPWADARTNAPDGVVDGQLLLTGVLPAGRHEVELDFRHAGGVITERFEVSTQDAVSGGLNGSFHAQNRLLHLLLLPDGPERDEQLRALGDECGIVTPFSSLLVLETLDQYLQHEVMPPDCSPELQSAYRERMAERMISNERTRQKSLSTQRGRAYRERQGLLAWYEQRDFSRYAPRSSFERVAEQARRGDYGGLLGSLASIVGEVMSSRRGNDMVRYASSSGSPRLFTSHLSSSDDAEARVFAAPEEPEPQIKSCNNNVSRPEEEGDKGEETASPTIQVCPWDSLAPYMAVLRGSEDPVESYRKQRLLYAASPGFYLDCADYFETAGHHGMAVQVLSNLLEMDLENRSLMRATASRLRYMGELDMAIVLFRKVQRLFSEEPQSHRDLALALADAHRWQEAVDAIRRVLEEPMDSRFHGVEQVAAVELAHIVAQAARAGVTLCTEGIAEAYLRPIEVDLRVVINWDTDLSDMDLWVTGEDGEKCYYAHRITSSGGHLSEDVREGYGPEEFLIRKAQPGNYKVQAHYYGTRSMKMLAPVTLYAELYTDYGRPTESRKTLVFRLDGNSRKVDVASMNYAQAR